jgi:hypothetical protein
MKRLFILLIFFVRLSFGQAVNLNEGLVAYYPIVNKSLNDFSNNRNDAQANGELFFDKDRFGNINGAVRFTGSQSDFFSKNSSTLNSIKENQAVAISAWIYIDDWNKNGAFPIMSKANNFSKDGFFVWLTQDGFNLIDGVSTFSFDFEIKTKKWYHIVVNFRYKSEYDVDWGFYVNNAGGMSDFTTLGLADTEDVELYFGKTKRNIDDVIEVEYATGMLDQVRIYDRLLNEKEIKTLYGESDNSNKFVVQNKPVSEIEQRIAIQPRTRIVEDLNSNSGENAQPVSVRVGKFYALIIGNNDYEDPKITKLDNPIDDARKLYETLISYYSFEKEDVMLLENATNAKTLEEFEHFSKIVGPDDSFLVFYAGHGYWDKNNRQGYWLPVDAKEKSKVLWLPNSRLKDYMIAIKSKHTLLITDACFSGGIFKTRSAFNDASMAINKLFEIPSRKAMTSGTLNEVPDESMFLKYLVKNLKENQDEYLSSDELFSRFRNAVTNNSPTTPQYGVIQDAGDEGGEFIFVRRK